jgi:hypothetical protein
MRSIYISGPLRGKTSYHTEMNIRAARDDAEVLWKLGFAVLCPHLNTIGMVGMLENEYHFIDADIVLMDGLDAVSMMHSWQTSEGAVVEHKHALKTNMDIFYRTAHDWHDLDGKRVSNHDMLQYAYGPASL